MIRLSLLRARSRTSIAPECTYAMLALSEDHVNPLTSVPEPSLRISLGEPPFGATRSMSACEFGTNPR